MQTDGQTDRYAQTDRRTTVCVLFCDRGKFPKELLENSLSSPNLNVYIRQPDCILSVAMLLL